MADQPADTYRLPSGDSAGDTTNRASKRVKLSRQNRRDVHVSEPAPPIAPSVPLASAQLIIFQVNTPVSGMPAPTATTSQAASQGRKRKVAQMDEGQPAEQQRIPPWQVPTIPTMPPVERPLRAATRAQQYSDAPSSFANFAEARTALMKIQWRPSSRLAEPLRDELLRYYEGLIYNAICDMKSGFYDAVKHPEDDAANADAESIHLYDNRLLDRKDTGEDDLHLTAWAILVSAI